MYRAKFKWLQSTDYIIYDTLIRHYVDRISRSGSNILNVSLVDNSREAVQMEITLDIIEDFSYEVKSNFQGYADTVREISNIAGSLLDIFNKSNMLSQLGGVSSDAQEWMKMQVWKDTEPFRFSFKFVLETKTDPFVDVYAPAMILTSMSILSPVTNKNKPKGVLFYAPGVNARSISFLKRTENLKEYTNTTNKPNSTSGSTMETNKINDKGLKAIKSVSKILDSFMIVTDKIDNSMRMGSNLMMYDVGDNELVLLGVKDAFIETAKPTWSRERTASGIPLRCDLELVVQSMFSANDSMFGYIVPNRNYAFEDQFKDTASKVYTNVFR